MFEAAGGDGGDGMLGEDDIEGGASGDGVIDVAGEGGGVGGRELLEKMRAGRWCGPCASG